MYSIQEVSQKTGLSAHTLREVLRFVQLTREGEHTLEERVTLLREHRENVLKRMEEMRRHLEKVTWKLNFFSEKLAAYRASDAEKQEGNRNK